VSELANEPSAPSQLANALRVPELSLVLLVGASGSGKSTFAARHFAPTEVLSSDAFRGLVSDDPDSQDAPPTRSPRWSTWPASGCAAAGSP
jgi:2-phosphoglycerate kinase